MENLEFFIKVMTSIGRSTLLDELQKENFLSQANIQQIQGPANRAVVPQDPGSREQAREYQFTECLMNIAHRLTSVEVSQMAYALSEALLGMSTDKIYSATHLFQLLQQRQTIHSH